MPYPIRINALFTFIGMEIMTTDTVEFTDLNFDERIAEVDIRIGDQPDRIKTPLELLPFYGTTVYIVVSPYGKEQNLGTCFIWEWDIGDIKDQHGNILREGDEIDVAAKKKFICYSHSSPDKGISLRDFNVYPNNYNNHCVFPTMDAAKAYVMYRKVQFMEDEGIARLDGEYSHHVTLDQVKRLLENEKQMADSED